VVLEHKVLPEQMAHRELLEQLVVLAHKEPLEQLDLKEFKDAKAQLVVLEHRVLLVLQDRKVLLAQAQQSMPQP
jgi:hypothetical protein